jgi:hypothetical protein
VREVWHQQYSRVRGVFRRQGYTQGKESGNAGFNQFIAHNIYSFASKKNSCRLGAGWIGLPHSANEAVWQESYGSRVKENIFLLRKMRLQQEGFAQ